MARWWKYPLGLALAAGSALLPLPLGSGCGDCDLEVETRSLPEGRVGEFYDERLRSDCGGDAWFLEEGNLPPGLTLQEDGDLRGTPLRAGIYDFTVSVVDIDGVDIDPYNDIAFAGLSISIE
jgi:hypothetical protein